MSTFTMKQRKGVTASGWSGTVDDYAIAGAWTSNGGVLVVADVAGGVFGFEGKSGKIRWAHRGAHGGGALSMAINPITDQVSTGGQDGRILTWNPETGALSQTIDLGKGWVENLTWSTDGKCLAASHSRRVHVYDVEGKEVWCSDDHPSTVSALAWSQSQELATACYGQVAFFDVFSGDVTQKLEWKGSLVSMVLSYDGDIVACGSQDNTVHFWRRSTGDDSMMSGYPSKPSYLAFDAKGSLLATGGGQAITVWSFQGDGPEGTRPGVLEAHLEPVTSLVFAPKGRILASGARDGSVAIWELDNAGNGGLIGGSQLDDLVAGISWRPDGRGLAAFDARGGVTTWRVRS